MSFSYILWNKIEQLNKHPTSELDNIKIELLSNIDIFANCSEVRLTERLYFNFLTKEYKDFVKELESRNFKVRVFEENMSKDKKYFITVEW